MLFLSPSTAYISELNSIYSVLKACASPEDVSEDSYIPARTTFR